MSEISCMSGDEVRCTNTSIDTYNPVWKTYYESLAASDLIYKPIDVGTHHITLSVTSKNKNKKDEITKLLTVTEAKGKVNFWTNGETCTPITVELGSDGQYNGIINKWSSSVPECGSSGPLTIQLPIGTYNYFAQDLCKVWSGYIAITKRNCTSQLLSR